MDSEHGGGARKNWPPEEADFPGRVSIPEHTLLRCIGRGSYGQVWLARNATGAYRAVKIVFRDSFTDARPFEREWSGIRKFEPISRLHEGFIDVLQVGMNQEQGYFYYIMELGDGQSTGQALDPATYIPRTLASEIARRGRISLPECLQLGLALSQALADLHEHGLVHRDIKPGNVIFVDGAPKLADIGLVTNVDDTRSFVGTTGFIAPEGPGKPAADLYSLGMVLYEASTGKDRHEYPFIPAEWSGSPEYGGLLELNEVILQACEMNPRERYGSAWEMHADLVVILNGQSVKRLKQLERRMAQLKHIAGIAGIVVTMIALAAYGLYQQWRTVSDERRRAVGADIAYGNRAMEAGDLLGALPLFTDALGLDQGRGLAESNDRLRVGSVLDQCPKLTHMWFEHIDVRHCAFSPDGKKLAVPQYFGTLHIYDLSSDAASGAVMESQPGLRSVAYSPDGRYLLTTSEDAQAVVRDAETLRPILRLPHPDKVFLGNFSPDGRRIVTACKDGSARIWDAQTGRLELRIRAHTDLLAAASFSHNGEWVATASHDHTARVWRADNGEPVTPVLAHPAWVNDIAFSPDDTRVVTASDDHRARVWEVPSGRRITPDLTHDDIVEAAAYSPDGQLLLTACLDGTVRLWRAFDLLPANPNPILRHGERVMYAAFDASGRRIASVCNDGTIRIWDLAGVHGPPESENRFYCGDGSHFVVETNQALEVRETRGGSLVFRAAEAGSPVALQLSQDGRFMLVATQPPNSTNRLLQVWDTTAGKQVGPDITTAFTGMALSDSGEHLATYSGHDGKLYETLTGHATSFTCPGAIGSAHFDPRGQRLAIAYESNIQVLDVARGREAYPALKLPLPVYSCGFSADGRFLVGCPADPGLTKSFAQVWDAQSGQPVGAPLRHGDGVLSAAFSPDAKRIATGSEDFTARIWDVETGKQLGLPLRHAAHVQATAWSPGGEWVATASLDRTARVWDPQTGDPLTPPLVQLSRLRIAQFLPDGRHLVTGGSQGNVLELKLCVDSRPAADLARIAALLSGGDFISPSGASKGATEPLEQLWSRLHERYPDQFSVSRQEVVRWHRCEVEAGEAAGEWSAAAFHLECLAKLCPNDVWVADNLVRAQAHLQSGN